MRSSAIPIWPAYYCEHDSYRRDKQQSLNRSQTVEHAPPLFPNSRDTESFI